MSLRFSAALTEAAYFDANRLHFWENVRSKRALQGLAWIVAIYFVITLGVDFYLDHPIGVMEVLCEVLLALVVGAVALAGCYATAYALLRRRTRQLFDQQKTQQAMTEFEITDTALIYSNEFTSGTLPFALAHKWSEDSSVFLLYISDQSFHVFPKSTVADTAIDLMKANMALAGRPGRKL